ncbi:MAG: hypothetical protein ACYTDY_15335 [Planctomycetota bacterium]
MKSSTLTGLPRTAAVALLVVALVSVPTLAAGEDEPEDLDAILRELDGVDSVGGKSVGFAGTESRFHRLFRRLLEADEEKLPERILESPNPVRRAMGLALLVERDGEKSIAVLRKRMADRGPATVNPHGCVQMYGSVGVVARGLLGNRNWIADYGRREPLLSKEELLSIDLDLLGRDDTVLHHGHVGGDVLSAIHKGELPLDLTALRKRYPAVSAVRLVKALGRLRSRNDFSAAQEDLDRWIRELAADRKQAVDVRLAAASALCRWSPREDHPSPRPFPGKSVADLPGKALAVLRRDHDAVRQAAAKGEDAPALAAGHALLATEIRGELLQLVRFDTGEGKRLPEHVTTGLPRLADRLGEWQPEWNTFGGGLYLLDAAVEEFGDRLKRELGTERHARLLKRLRAAIAADG